MNLSVRQLNTFSQVEEIYTSRMMHDFGEDEIRPLSALQKFWNRGEYFCYGLYDRDKLLAYAFFLGRGRHFLLDYLAVSPEHRGEGLGSVFLRELTNQFPDADCVLVEVEDPAAAQTDELRSARQRRMRFYSRNGFYDTGIASRTFGVDYRLLNIAAEKNLSASEIREIYTGMYRSMLPRHLYEAKFFLK
jgi:GNAT superfamily N-acetyltransferase